MDIEFKARLVNVKLKHKPSCNHQWRSLWNDYYSWAAECVKCGKSIASDHD